MKQVLQFRRSGATRVVDVPAPMVPRGGLLVHNRCSLISPGTERMLVEAGGANLINTARQRPDLVRQVADKAMRDGVSATLESIRGRLDVTIPLGYSCAGVAIEVDDRVAAFLRAGDRVACAGAGQANHAEYVAVARNLTARIPDQVSFEDAAFVTVGAIALHGVRQAQVHLGESGVVIGLGLVGQLTVQLLKAAGCRVFGIDVASDKVELALRLGADAASVRGDDELLGRVREFSNGRGADAVLITAATTSSDPIQLAPRLARDRATVVALGMVGMDVPRNAYYEKELQLRQSRSYGPGRYDRTYEEEGVDYPLGYVRWTEQRNMQAFLDLVAAGKVQPSALVTHRLPIEQAEHAYRIVTGEVKEPYLGILLQYPDQDSPPITRVAVAHPPVPLTSDTVKLGVVGAGSFARSVLLPRMRGLDVELRGVATATGSSAQQTAVRFGFAFATTNWQQVLDDCDAVVVATRHNLHATIATAALRAGKAVFLEKPMALDEHDLEVLLEAWRNSGRVLQVGFNRRFAPGYRWLKGSFDGPLVMSYRVNAGAVAPGSWVLDPELGGGRVIGEVCHMVDLLFDLAGARLVSVHAQPGSAGDDVVLTLAFEDGSVGTIVYASGGDRTLPKERLEVFGSGRAGILDDFLRAQLFAGGRKTSYGGRFGSQDKGHAAELQAFVEALRKGERSPVDPEGSAHVTRVTFAAVESLHSGLPVRL